MDNYVTLGGLKPQILIPITRKLPKHYEDKLKDGYVMRRKDQNDENDPKPPLVPPVGQEDKEVDGTVSKLQVEIYLALEQLEEDMRPICHELRRQLKVDTAFHQLKDLEKKLEGKSDSWRPCLEKAVKTEDLEEKLRDARYDFLSLSLSLPTESTTKSTTESTKNCFEDMDRAFSTCIQKLRLAKQTYDVESTASCQWFLGRWWKSTVDPKSMWKNERWGLCRAVPVSEPCLDRIPEPLKKKASAAPSVQDFLSPKLELALAEKSVTSRLCKAILGLKKVETDDTSDFDKYWRSFCLTKNEEPHAAAQSLGQGHVLWREHDALEMACEMATLGNHDKRGYVLCQFLKFCKEHLLKAESAEILQKWAARIVTCGEWEKSIAEVLKQIELLKYLEFWCRCVVQQDDEEKVWNAVCLHPGLTKLDSI